MHGVTIIKFFLMYYVVRAENEKVKKFSNFNKNLRNLSDWTKLT
jgi:hypothetical protein